MGPLNRAVRRGGVLLVAGLAAGVAQADVLNVPSSQFSSIQAAINGASDGDVIVVAPGVYLERIDMSGKAVALRSASGASSTILDGQGLGTVILCQAGEGFDTIIDGFTIRNGAGDGGPSGNHGGGMYIKNAGPTVLNCVFTSNTCSGTGGAIHTTQGATANIVDCDFIANSADSGGGAVSLISSFVTISGSNFVNNTSYGTGGAVSMFGGDSTLDACTFTGNSSDFYGGAVRMYGQSTVLNSTFTDNYAGYGGGGITAAGSSGLQRVEGSTFIGNTAGQTGGGFFSDNPSNSEITGCRFYGNVAETGGGGGAACSTNAHASFSNCAFADNYSSADGGGLNCFYSFVHIANCTFAMNDTGTTGGGLWVYNAGSGSTTICNSILWANSAGDLVDVSPSNNRAVATFCNIQSGWNGPGSNNISVNPQFVSLSGAEPDLRLASGSGCIDAGDSNALPQEVDTDASGEPRFLDDPMTPDSGVGDPVVDMGAFEYQATEAPGCPGDWTGDGLVNSSDFFGFITLYLAGSADFDGNGQTDSGDFFAFLGAFLGGC